MDVVESGSSSLGDFEFIKESLVKLGERPETMKISLQSANSQELKTEN
jgi:hypothetical protein